MCKDIKARLYIEFVLTVLIFGVLKPIICKVVTFFSFVLSRYFLVAQFLEALHILKGTRMVVCVGKDTKVGVRKRLYK